MKSRTKMLRFDRRTAEAIWNRDNGSCIFCSRAYYMESSTQLGYEIKDIMHFIPKSQGGLGIERNGVLGCRYHHMLMDNGSKGLRAEMLKIMEEYLKSCYPEWSREGLVYKKGMERLQRRNQRGV